ncbi:MAG: aerobic carbon-monoxide dehydrogenase medium subunit [Thermoleophilaceae bacterium]|nr:aerobic carbon-monoxide dehydrogenase medium subunit [Thermoleophilaceae bacterium]
MKPSEFEYAAPDTLDEAIGLLAGDPGAKVLAGGQSLVPLLSLRLAAPSLLVDLRRVPDLAGVERTNGDVTIGAMVRQRSAERDDVIRDAVPLMTAALHHIAHPQVRSQGTIGGSVAHADPAAELPAVLVALDGRVRVRGPRGERVIAAADFFTGFLSTELAEDEIVTALELDAAPAHTGAACVEIAQRAGDYALCGALAQVTLDGDRVASARVALFGIGDRPLRARAVEAALTGEPATPEAAAAAAADAGAEADPIDDPQVPAEYRLHLATVVTRRALEQAMEDAAA